MPLLKKEMPHLVKEKLKMQKIQEHERKLIKRKKLAKKQPIGVVNPLHRVLHLRLP